jgi:hypothetical protein
MIRNSLAAMGLAALAAFATPSFAEEKPMPRLITLSGHGEVRARPDTAVVTAGVMSQAATARDALTANNAAMEKLLKSLADAGIAAADIQTSNFSVNPRYEYVQDGSRAPNIIGYDVSNNVTVTVRKLDNLGPILDQIVSAGSNQVNGVQFMIDKPDELADRARAEAVKDAERKAETYAKAAKVRIGKVMSISEGVNYQPPMPVYAKAMRAEAAAPPSVPIAEGEQAVTVDVNMTWELE